MTIMLPMMMMTIMLPMMMMMTIMLPGLFTHLAPHGVHVCVMGIQQVGGLRWFCRKFSISDLFF